VFGIASVVQADIPDSGVIHGCYGKPGTPYKGNLRVRDTSIGEQCPIYENPLDWNQIGPTGVTGPTGPTGPQGGINAIERPQNLPRCLPVAREPLQAASATPTPGGVTGVSSVRGGTNRQLNPS
jgi:hypothetical protein